MRRPKPIYSPNWKEFSRFIRYDRAEGRCECWGLCGLHRTHPGPRRCAEIDRTPAQWARGRVVLTVAHICTCASPCAREDHVLAMCQKCHLLTDKDMHIAHAAETRRRERVTVGQLSFLEL